jgi:hypothetical protein
MNLVFITLLVVFEKFGTFPITDLYLRQDR